MTSIHFGTDGWRGQIADDYTFDNVRIVAQAAAEQFLRSGAAADGIVVGYDTRFLSRDFAIAAAEVLAANGIHVALTTGPVATPALSHAVVSRGAGSGVIITASHNPGVWNGFKVKERLGNSSPPTVTGAIEASIPEVIAQGRVKRTTLAAAEASGLIEHFDQRAPFIAALRKLVDIDLIRGAGLHVLVDSMYGAGGGLIAELLAGGTTVVEELHGAPNPAFPGIHAPEPIARNLSEQLARLQAGGFDIGISTDGDADRLGLADEHGTFITQLQAFALLAHYLLSGRGERGALVRSVTTTRMIDRLGERYGVPVIETPVGFVHLGPKMMETNALIAGEESGGYAIRGHIPERDGVLTGLIILEAMVRTGKRPSELLQALQDEVGPHEYDRVDITLRGDDREAIRARAATAAPETIAGLKVVSRDNVDGFRFVLEGGWWLLFRFSGTEPLLRIYAEMPTKDQVQQALQTGKELAGVAL